MPEQKQNQNQNPNPNPKRDPYSDVEPGHPVFPPTEEREDIESVEDIRYGSHREDDSRVGEEDTGPDKAFRK